MRRNYDRPDDRIAADLSLDIRLLNAIHESKDAKAFHALPPDDRRAVLKLIRARMTLKDAIRLVEGRKRWDRNQ